jgi:Predicted membrane GTPase involved in stress response
VGMCSRCSELIHAAAEEYVRLTPPRKMNFEQAMEWITQDKLIEVTPDAIRIRKKKK